MEFFKKKIFMTWDQKCRVQGSFWSKKKKKNFLPEIWLGRRDGGTDGGTDATPT